MGWRLFGLLAVGVALCGLEAAPPRSGDAVKKETKDDKFKAETVRGIIRNATTSEVTLDVAGKTMAVQLTPDSRITIDRREGKATDLKVGQEVRCTHVRRDGRNICREIVVVQEKK